jgi:hypothetical protein
MTIIRFAIEYYSRSHRGWVIESYSKSPNAAHSAATELKQLYGRARVRTLKLTPMMAYQMGLS